MELVFGMIFGIVIFMIGGVYPIFLEKLKLDLQVEKIAIQDVEHEEEEEVETVTNVRHMEKPLTSQKTETYYDELRRELSRTEGLFDLNPPQYEGGASSQTYYPLYDDDSVEIVTPEHEKEAERRANRL